MERASVGSVTACSQGSVNVREPSGEPFTRRVCGLELFVNFFADCAASLDICCLFSDVSRTYHPSKRALYIPGTPRMVCDLPVDDIAAYYQLAVYTILPDLLVLPQAVFWPGDVRFPHAVDAAEPLRFGVNIPSAMTDRALPESCAALERARERFAPLQLPGDDAMFEVVVEDEIFPGFFSEGLVRALLLEKVPVYYGDPRAGEYFDLASFVRFEPRDFEGALACVNEEFFIDRSKARKSNRKRALKMTDPAVLLAQDVIQRVSTGGA